ncbi:MAG: penicillin-binding protein 1C [bacterium]|nr:penicillin-binding protein 1C [bacterium]
MKINFSPKYWALDKNIKGIVIIVLILWLTFFVLNLLYPLPTYKLKRPLSTAVFSREGELLRTFCASDGQIRIKCKLNEISPFLLKAVVIYEDKWFYWHPGINPYAIWRTAMTNIKHRRIVCGGSTISMQIARMIEPKSRTFLSKIIEIFRTIQLELRYSKNELLEFYFNLASYGGNLEGVASAAYFYFGKAPSTLSSAEATLLVGLPNSPERLRPDKNPKEAIKNYKKVATRLLRYKFISKEKYLEIISADIPQKRRNIPFIAPHLGEFVRSKFKDKPIIKTSIDLRLQRFCEKSLAEHLKPLLGQGISNGAIVVIENKTCQVRAMVGSLNFFDKIHPGQVNGALSPRSPGSTLKPFVYALGLDEGFISSQGLLPDVPVDYSGYSPANYDDKYHGGVTVEQALKESLNIPAINLYAKLKRFYNFLQEAGISTLKKPREFYGLPLVLGACEVNLLELTNLYATLANSGQYRNYSLLEDEKVGDSKRLVSAEAAYIISEILTEIRRPDLPACWEFSVNLPKVAWKTGTSYGHRDAWSIGYNPDYTIGIWLGNFDGTEAESLVGAEVAAPLLFYLFNSITEGKSDWFEKPQGVGIRQVCALSGELPSSDCPQTKEELFIYGVSTPKICQMHKMYDLDDKTNCRLCSHCRQKRKYHKELFVIWPAEIATWMEREGYPIQKIPPHLPECSTLVAGKKPIIRSPATNCGYYLREGVSKKYQKILLDASVSNEVEKIYWFVDGELLCSAAPKEKAFYYPTIGKHRLKCVDDEGRCTEMELCIY